MLVFFVIPVGSRTPFTPLRGLRRSKLLIQSRAWRVQMERFRRSAKRRKELRDLVRQRGILRDADESGTEIFDILDVLDGGMGKPHEQVTLEWWLWEMKKEPRHFSRNPP